MATPPSSNPREAKSRDANPSRLQMADIARLANVSIATVSRALSNSPRISLETRTRINELAKSLNYSINFGAQNLRGKQSRTVAVTFPYHPMRRGHFKDPFFMTLIGSIGDALLDSGNKMLLFGLESDHFSMATQPYETGQAIGTLVLGQDGNHQRFNELAVRGIPFVAWGARLQDQLYCTVGSDNALGGELATDHLLAGGAKRIAFMGDKYFPEIALRYEGYVRAHEKHGLTPDATLCFPISFVVEDMRNALEDILRRGCPFDAVFACSDVMAITLMSVLRGHNIRVPEDVAIVGFDDIGLAANAHPALTTIRQPIEAAGKALVQLLMAKLNGETVESLVLPPELVVRESTRV